MLKRIEGKFIFELLWRKEKLVSELDVICKYKKDDV